MARAWVLQGSSEVSAGLAASFCLHISLLTLHWESDNSNPDRVRYKGTLLRLHFPLSMIAENVSHTDCLIAGSSLPGEEGAGQIITTTSGLAPGVSSCFLKKQRLVPALMLGSSICGLKGGGTVSWEKSACLWYQTIRTGIKCNWKSG